MTEGARQECEESYFSSGFISWFSKTGPKPEPGSPSSFQQQEEDIGMIWNIGNQVPEWQELVRTGDNCRCSRNNPKNDEYS